MTKKEFEKKELEFELISKNNSHSLFENKIFDISLNEKKFFVREIFPNKIFIQKLKKKDLK